MHSRILNCFLSPRSVAIPWEFRLCVLLSILQRRTVVFFLREENDTLEHSRRACGRADVRLVSSASEEIGQTVSECQRQKAAGLHACGDISSRDDDLHL